jgi:transcriptional regulator with XRE-family HTH domain
MVMDTAKYKEIVKKSVSKAVECCGTQMELAKRAGITQGAVGKYVRGETLPTGVTANKLSKAVNYQQPPSDFAPHIFQPTSETTPPP